MQPTGNTRGWWPAEALVRRSAPSPVAAAHPSGAAVGGGGLAQLLAQRSRAAPTGARDSRDDLDGLDQLTTLCLAEADDAAITTSDEGEPTGPPQHQQQPVNRVLHLGRGVKKGDTADSTTMASLLHTLQQGYGDGPAQLLPQGQQQQLATTTNTAAAVGLGGAAAARPAAVSTLVVEGDECEGDVPLLSRRHQPCYHYSPLVTKDTPTVVDSSIAWQSSPSPSGRGAGVECDASVLVQPPGASSPLAAVVDVVVSAASARVPVVSLGMGATPVVESPSSALQEQKQQHPAWPAQACSLLFAGVFLTAESREVLAALVPPVHPLLRADHLTLAYRPSVSQLLQLPLGAQAVLHVVGSASDARTQAVFVNTPGWLQPTTSASTHITISLALGARAVEAGGLIRDALQRTAYGAAAEPGTAAGGASYQHFDEPLPLVGHVGVRMAVPAAVAAQLRQAGRLAHQAGQSQVLRQGPSGVEEEVVLLSIADVAATGCITLDESTLQLLRSRHAGTLGAAARVEGPAAATPRASSPDPSTTLAVVSNTAAGAADDASSLELAAAPEDCRPSSSSSSSATAAPGALSVAVAATSCTTPAASPPSGQGLLELVRGARAHAAATTSNHSPVLLQAPTAAATAATPSPQPGSPGGCSDASSDGSDDAVQFLSAVHAGDYVALRPFAPTAHSGQRLVQGFVREFACDEPFQAGGVLVVLRDDTIGFVTAVLDHARRPCRNSSSGVAAATSSSSKPAAAKGRGSSKGAKAAGASPSAAAAGVAYPVDPASLPGISSGGFGNGAIPDGLLAWEDLLPAGAAAADEALGASTSGLRAGSSGAAAAAGGYSSLSGDGRRRNARDAERDLQLWRGFEALQRQHGEALCSSILESCNQDFAEAIALITAQASTLQEAAAAAAAAAASKAAGIAAAAATAEAFAASRSASLAEPLAVEEGAEEGSVPATDEGYVAQLAQSLGLSPSGSVELARLVPHVSAHQVVQQLREQGGDVNRAAEVLLASAEAADTAAAAEAAEAAAAAAATAQAAAAAEAAEAAARSAPSSPVGGRRQGLTPEARAAASFLSSKDADRVATARELCALFPGVQLDMAELLLQEHGDSLPEAARALSDMQARELEARSAAAGGGDVASSSSRRQQQVPSTLAGAAASAGTSTSAQLLTAVEGMGLSEADQRAILAAMAGWEGEQQQHQEQQQLAQQPMQPAYGLPTTPAAQRVQPPHPADYYYHPADPQPSRHQHPAVAAAAAALAQQQAAPPPPPPPPPPQRRPQQHQAFDFAAEQEAKAAAKVAADLLFDKSRKLKAAADVYVSAAQSLLKEGDEGGARKQLTEADKCRVESRAAFDEAQALSWRSNNTRSNCWEIDLHGLSPVRALDKFVQQLAVLQMMDHPGGVLFRVIVGQGHHSENNVPKIKLGVLQYLQEQGQRVLEDQGGVPWGVSWQVDPSNPGVINVHIPQHHQQEAHEQAGE